MKKSLLFLFFAFMSIVLNAQVVRGRVIDSTGEPIIGASVMEKGTLNGTITDIDGYFSLQVSKSPTALIVSYIGYQTVEVKPVYAGKYYTITLKEDVVLLESRWPSLTRTYAKHNIL